MRNFVDEERVARGARMGKIATFGGLGLLIAGFVISLAIKQPAMIWVSFACLIGGLMVSSIGTYNMNRWVREPRGDQALAQALKGRDDRYQLYNYFLPAPHVLLSPKGLYVLTALGQEGTIQFDGEKFRRNFSLLRLLRFMAEEGMGKPLAQGDAEVDSLRQFLEANDASEGVEIQNILVFYSPRAELQVSNAPRPITVPKGLKKTLRKLPDGGLAEGQYERLEDLFDEEAGLEIEWV
ncbi:MAG: nuclease-related domain-containing protein [Anaerolineae bacterium]|jgi:hypothetical protein